MQMAFHVMSRPPNATVVYTRTVCQTSNSIGISGGMSMRGLLREYQRFSGFSAME